MGTSSTIAKARLSSGMGNRPMRILGIKAGEFECPLRQTEIESGLLCAGAGAPVSGRISQVRDKREWQGWQEYRPAPDDFNRPFIFSLIQFYHEPHI
jgi:hypothetical protein